MFQALYGACVRVKGIDEGKTRGIKAKAMEGNLADKRDVGVWCCVEW